ncbi:MAG: hypothetical protein KDD94_04570 [Calditrichaeota bacterium]|nr:hypothetical protein [Calditrichota bacterium]
MKFKAIWWLTGVVGESNLFRGTVFDYQPVWGTGNALIKLSPATKPFGADDTRNKDFDDLEIPEVDLSKTPNSVSESKSPSKTHKATINKSANAVTFAETESNDTQINSEKAPLPVGPYPHARREGDLLYLSGVGPRSRNSKQIPGVELDENGEIVSYDVAIQTQSVIDNVKAILESAGSHFDKIVDVQVFLTNMKDDFKTFNDVYAKNFVSNKPTRTTVAVTALPTPISVEFKVVAKV